MHLPPGDKTFSQKKDATRADALVVRVEHWTPMGDCTERGDKEISDQKKFSKKVMRFFRKRQKINSEFPLNLIWDSLNPV